MSAGGGWADLVDTFRSADLPVPPVPESLRDAVEHVGRWNWATRPLRGPAMYDLPPSLVERLVALSEPCLAISHGGHGANSYAITYLLAYRRLVLAMQVGWGGVYMDDAAQAAIMTDLFRGCQQLIDTEERLGANDSTNNGGRRLVCLESDLRGHAECGWVSAGRYERHFVDRGRALSIAQQALDANRT